VFLLALIATLAVVAPNGTLSAVGPAMAHELGTGAQPSWSPDGLRLAFVRDGDVWTIDAMGSNATRLTAVPPQGRHVRPARLGPVAVARLRC